MRNVVFILALGMAAFFQFAHQFFPTFTALGPAYESTNPLDFKTYAPPSGPATWMPESATGERPSVRPACLEIVLAPVAPRVTGRPDLAPACGVGDGTTEGDPFRGL